MKDHAIELSNRLYILLAILVGGTLLCMGLYTLDAYKDGTAYDQISVEGTSTITMTPDVAYVDLTVSTEKADSAEAISENMSLTEAVVATVLALGVEEKDVQTQNFSVYPNYEYVDGEYVETGYAAQQRIVVTLHDFSLISSVISQSSEAGANLFNGVSFELEEYESELANARTEAIAEARAKAEAIADASGSRLGKLVSYYEYTDDYDYGKGGGYYEMAMEELSEEYIDTIQAGQEEITLTVNLSYRLK